MSKRIRGIDFGTSTSLAAERTDILDPVTISPLGKTTNWMPTVLALPRSGEILVGEEAANHPNQNDIVRSIKSLIYRPETFELPNHTEASADSLIIFLLEELKKRIMGSTLNHLEDEIFLSCPSLWEASHRKKLVELAGKAGLNASLLRLIDEPISAGISWISHFHQDNQDWPEGTVLIFDNGGGTLDVAVLQVSGDPNPAIQVLSSFGNLAAGDKYDEQILKDLKKKYPHACETPEQETLLRNAGKRLKELLSTDPEAVTFLGDDSEEPISYTADEFKIAAEPLLENSTRLMNVVLRQSKLRTPGVSLNDLHNLSIDELFKDIDWLLFSGGMSQSPIIQEHVKSFCPEAKIAVDTGITSPEEAVVSGLTFAGELIENLNLDRPAFSFIAEYTHQGRVIGKEVLYEAFSPLEENYASKTALYSKRTGLGIDRDSVDVTIQNLNEKVPAGSTYGVRISCQRIDGKDLLFDIYSETAGDIETVEETSESFPYISIGLKRKNISANTEHGHFVLYLDGRIVLKGKNQPETFQLDSWPSITSNNPPPIKIIRKDSRVDTSSNLCSSCGAPIRNNGHCSSRCR